MSTLVLLDCDFLDGARRSVPLRLQKNIQQLLRNTAILFPQYKATYSERTFDT